MLLSHWIKCISGDHRYSRRFVDPDSKETPEDLNNWFMIYNTNIKKFGLNPKYEQVLKVMRKIALLELKFVRTRDPFLATLISIQEVKLKKFRKKKEGQVSIERLLVYISKWYGQHLRPNEITVTEFNILSEEYGKAN